jgi:hypothetical protein
MAVIVTQKSLAEKWFLGDNKGIEGAAMNTEQATCQHRYLTSYFETGWICSACRVPMLSLMMPIPLPLIAEALKVVVSRAAPSPVHQGQVK